MEDIHQVLDKNEKVLWDGKPNFWPFVLGSMLLSVVGLFFIAIPLFMVMASGSIFILIMPHFWIGIALTFGGPLYSWLVYRYIHYAITNKRVIIKSGLVGRDFKIVDYDKITNAEVNISIWDRLLAKSSGSIYIFTAGTISYGRNGPYHTPYRLSNVPEPYKVFKYFKKVSFDVKTDIEYPNKYRPDTNPGYKTRYEGTKKR
ncbi:MAG: PH domain-containing protein [Candidatus Aenigmatarchaeota archaeon]|nr:MAG: PH domain-containing protein [Candidatus Aenigmarchaeota archaeon]